MQCIQQFDMRIQEQASDLAAGESGRVIVSEVVPLCDRPEPFPGALATAKAALYEPG